MNKIPGILTVLLIACNNPVSHKDEINKEKHDSHAVSSTKEWQVNNGARHKADDPTRKNVAAMVQTINDPDNLGKENSAKLTKQLQGRIDTLVQQCKMSGPEHDALHAWLEKVLEDLKEIKEKEGDEYQKSYAALKKDVESFYNFFE
jgi:hypothetical protein